MKKILVTGSHGFIGSNLILKFLENKSNFIVGIDYNINSSKLRKLRNKKIKNHKNSKNFKFINHNLKNKIKERIKFDIIIHLAAQPGVQLSKTNKQIYIDNNITGLINILDYCSNQKIKNFFYASSSSVYGNLKFQSEHSKIEPTSFYGLTKKFGEEIIHHYSKNCTTKFIALRFFTVYGPLGRTDMSYFKFLNQHVNKKKISLYNYGKNKRSFTYIDDITYTINLMIDKIHIFKDKFNVYNIGNPECRSVNEIVKYYNLFLKRKINSNKIKSITQDPLKTHAIMKKLKKKTGNRKFVKLDEGLNKFLNWYKETYLPKNFFLYFKK